MSDLERFWLRVMEDESVQVRLRDIAEQREFVSVCRTVAAELGLTLSDPELETLLRDGRRRWLERHLL